MALISCYECSTPMSTAAAACPKCGAPAELPLSIQPAKSWKWITIPRIVGGIAIVSAFSVVMNNVGQQSSDYTEPSHNYVQHENGEYGYKSPISGHDNEQNSPMNQLTIVRYLGTHNGVINFLIRGSQNYLVTCEEPCYLVRMQISEGNQLYAGTNLQNKPGSLIHAVISDATAGQLEEYKEPATTP